MATKSKEQENRAQGGSGLTASVRSASAHGSPANRTTTRPPPSRTRIGCTTAGRAPRPALRCGTTSMEIRPLPDTSWSGLRPRFSARRTLLKQRSLPTASVPRRPLARIPGNGSGVCRDDLMVRSSGRPVHAGVGERGAMHDNAWVLRLPRPCTTFVILLDGSTPLGQLLFSLNGAGYSSQTFSLPPLLPGTELSSKGWLLSRMPAEHS